jgi:hypothetical protein
MMAELSCLFLCLFASKILQTTSPFLFYLHLIVQTLREAFYKFDDNRTGNLTKKNFRRMLDSFMCIMSDEEYERLCERHGITRSTRISYREFLDRFEVRDTADGHKWLNSVHR